ncbi:hypothetical protein TVAG_006390 [Trichomonas vaginalis G3]|uniref:Uncharacterized protein n=1 Tax=Trichomonas vaginalis (strain ATCC PRA-98 / G3) TaxID=412133 RepID=A2E746_TRIV3|nr:(trans)glycosidase family protein [Trichomonas vaginalis G3]EAY11564.1 hypothetical protein TVAG_006390 [Trichomonas vaginalis G3]KAI5489448.1 (trans)glycosidase family protein [Trichomonas vaginalis G3]|eukprot:XP_001323787.1 hypothetical protein [Trichomonas vaginalis G3]
MNTMNILFNLEIPDHGKKVVQIRIENETYEMNKLPNTGSKIKTAHFQAYVKLEWPKTYPHTLNYSYSFDSFRPRTLIVRFPANTDLIVNDTDEIKQELQNFHQVIFYVNINIVTDSTVLILSPFPSFLVDNRFVDHVQMTKVKTGCYYCKVFLSADMLFPLQYKYLVVTPSKIEEKGRSHVLSIISPIAGKTIYVIDYFNHSIIPLPYFPRPLYPANARPFATIMQIEYIPDQPAASSLVQLSNAKPEPLLRDVGFRFTKNVAGFSTYSKIAIGSRAETNGPSVTWNPNDANELVQLPMKYDIVSIRAIKGVPNKRSFGIFVQLSTLRSSINSKVGDFSSLFKIIDFAKMCGIGHIHVGIDRINDNRLIDPVLSSIPVNLSEAKDLSEMRAIKLKALQDQFAKWDLKSSQDKQFNDFSKIYGSFLSPFCNDKFSLFTQYILHKELQQISSHAFDLGINLIIDAIADGVNGSLEKQIQLFTPYAQYIKIVNASLCFSPVTIHDMYIHFGEMSATAKKFLTIRGSNVQLNENLSNKIISECGLPAEQIGSFVKMFDEFKKLFTQPKRASITESFFQFFKQISNVAPCTFIMDQAGLELVPNDKLKEIGIIPCDENNFFEPSFLSPEFLTEFTESELQNANSQIVQRMHTAPIACTVYLLDLLRVVCGNKTPTVSPIQSVVGHQRFVLSKSCDELISDAEITAQIKSLLVDTHIIWI